MSYSNRLLILSLLFLLSVCAAVETEGAQHDSHLDSRSSEKSCRLDGNSDLYGLGIRLGYYFQGFSAWLANFFALEESRQLRPTNALFMVAMFVALIFISHDPSEVHAIEGFVVLQLLLVIFYVASSTVSRWSEKFFEFDPVRYAVNMLAFVGVLVYNLWFWWVGLATFKESSCGTHVFWFAKVDLYGWYKSMYAVLAIIGLVYHLLAILPFKFTLFMDYLQREKSPRYYQDLAQVLGDIEKFEGEKVAPVLLARPSRRMTWAAPSAKGIPQMSETSFEASETVTSDSEGLSDIASTNSTSHSAVNGLPSMTELEAADRFINTTVSDHPYPKRELHFLACTARFHIIPLSQLLSGYSPEVLKLALFKYRATIVPTILHICTSDQHPIFLQSYFLQQAVSALETKQYTFSQQALRTVLAMRVAALPDQRHRSFYIWNMFFGMLILSGLVISTELALYWNNISDTTDLASVGQLVPLIIGAGGMLKVLWKCILDRREGYNVVSEPSPLSKEISRCSNIFYHILEKKQQTNKLDV